MQNYAYKRVRLLKTTHTYLRSSKVFSRMLTSSHFLLHSSARAPNHLDKPLVAHQPTLLAIGRDGGDKLLYARKDGNTKWTGAKHSFNYFNIINDHYLHHFVVKIAI